LTTHGTLGWGFVGASAIADEWMAGAVQDESGSRLVAVMSRDPARARAFAARHGLPSSYCELETLLADPAVDIVYISRVTLLSKARARAARPIERERRQGRVA